MAAKYDTPSDPYVDPTTGIMRNSVGARTQPELDRIEAAFASVRAYELEKVRPSVATTSITCAAFTAVCSVTCIPGPGNSVRRY
ncbi:hypothetical protein N8D55_22685 (plasmid) [Xanthomonas hortorum pv. pelargonii]|nr:hypothetical protein N8D55_22685 [Xanthomonas hortorum pv. pelargonii]